VQQKKIKHKNFEGKNKKKEKKRKNPVCRMNARPSCYIKYYPLHKTRFWRVESQTLIQTLRDLPKKRTQLASCATIT